MLNIKEHFKINHEMGFSQIKDSRVRPEQLDDEEAVERRYMMIHRKMIQKGHDIIHISILGHDLFVVTMSKIFKCKMVSNKNITK